MAKSTLIALVAFFSISFFTLSCKNNDDPKPAKSSNITFEVNGNFSGSLNTTYITSNGGGTTESISAMPWTKNITYAATVPSTSISIVGAGGSAGQSITLKVLAGGKEVSSTSATATNSGTISLNAPSYTF